MNKMKKYLPFIFLGVGVLVLVLVFMFIKGKKTTETTDDGGTLIEVAFPDRPFASLTPTVDGHYINLKIEKIKVPKAVSMDYELLYSLPDGRAQGVPGTADLKDQTVFERKLLLGSESSGKFRYDEGVEEGSLTIRFRDSKGKLLAKFSTKFHLQSDVSELASIDESFVYKFDKKPKGIFFVTMETFGLPSSSNIASVTAGPYGIFSSTELPKGTAEGWQITTPNIFYK